MVAGQSLAIRQPQGSAHNWQDGCDAGVAVNLPKALSGINPCLLAAL